MYKGKPVVIRRSWWRHRIFPLGFYSLSQDTILTEDGRTIEIEGYYSVGDGGAATFKLSATQKADNSGTILVPPSDGAVKVKWFGAKGDN